MFSTGNATVHVSDLSAAIRFYTDTLGFTLTNRFGDRWATVSTGPSYWATKSVRAGLIIGLRPFDPAQGKPPGTRGGVGFGVETYRPIEEVEAEFTKRGVRVASEIIRFEAGHTFAFEDLDGLPSYAHEFPPLMLDAHEREENAASGADRMLLSGGHAIVFVSNMHEGVRFYTEMLGLPLTNRFENHFATVEVGRSLVLGIHPRTPNTPIPGTRGSVTLSLVVDEPIGTVLSRLAKRGVRISGHSDPRASTAQSADLEDPDGNVITLWEADAMSGRPLTDLHEHAVGR